jgi:hypothetical protein
VATPPSLTPPSLPLPPSAGSQYSPAAQSVLVRQLAPGTTHAPAKHVCVVSQQDTPHTLAVGQH